MAKKLFVVFVVCFFFVFVFLQNKPKTLKNEIISLDERFENLLASNLTQELEKTQTSIQKAIKNKKNKKNIDIKNVFSGAPKHQISAENINKIKDITNDLYKIAPNLNPFLFEKGKLTKQAKKQIFDYLFYYIDFFEKKGLINRNEFEIKDIIIRGSMGGFLYHKASDIDVDICIKPKSPFSKKKEYELFGQMAYEYFASLFDLNYNHHVSFYGMPINIFLNNCKYEEYYHTDRLAFATGVYSVFFDKWLLKPKKHRFNFSKQNFYEYILNFYQQFIKDYKDFENAKINSCNKYIKNWGVYKNYRDSAFVSLNQEAYSLANLGNKAIEKLGLLNKYNLIKENCKASLKYIKNESQKPKILVSKDLYFEKKQKTHFDLDKKGSCKSFLLQKEQKKKLYSKLGNFLSKKQTRSLILFDEKLKLKKQAKKEILNDIKYINSKNLKYIKSNIKEVIIYGKQTSLYHDKFSKIKVGLVFGFENVANLSKTKFRYVRKLAKTLLKIKALRFNAQKYRKFKNLRIEAKIFFKKPNCNKQELSCYFVFEDKFIKNPSSPPKINNKKLEKDFYYLYNISSQKTFYDACDCLENKKEIKSKFLMQLEEYEQFEKVKNICKILDLSVGDYKKYQELF